MIFQDLKIIEIDFRLIENWIIQMKFQLICFQTISSHYLINQFLLMKLKKMQNRVRKFLIVG
jgi:hypothetical protein